MRIESDDSSRGPEFGALKSRKKQNTIYIYPTYVVHANMGF